MISPILTFGKWPVASLPKFTKNFENFYFWFMSHLEQEKLENDNIVRKVRTNKQLWELENSDVDHRLWSTNKGIENYTNIQNWKFYWVFKLIGLERCVCSAVWLKPGVQCTTSREQSFQSWQWAVGAVNAFESQSAESGLRCVLSLL